MDVIKVNANGTLEIVDVDFNNMQSVYDLIGGFEVVRTQALRKFFNCNAVMIVDDNFFAHNKPYNYAASDFYGGDILGDVLIICEEYGEFVPFPDSAHEAIQLFRDVWFKGEEESIDSDVCDANMLNYLFSFRREGCPEEEAYFVCDGEPGNCFDMFMLNYPMNVGESITVKLVKILTNDELLRELDNLETERKKYRFIGSRTIMNGMPGYFISQFEGDKELVTQFISDDAYGDWCAYLKYEGYEIEFCEE